MLEKIYVFAISNSGIGQQYVAVKAETGEIITTHFCSNFNWAKVDLSRVKKLDNEVIFLEFENLPPQEVINNILDFYKVGKDIYKSKLYEGEPYLIKIKIDCINYLDKN